MADLQLRGDKELIRSLRGFGDGVFAEAQTATRAVGKELVRKLKSFYGPGRHYVTGRLQRSVKFRMGSQRARTIIARVKVGGRGARHSVFLEHGTVHMRARPFFRGQRTLAQLDLRQKLNRIADKAAAKFNRS